MVCTRKIALSLIYFCKVDVVSGYRGVRELMTSLEEMRNVNLKVDNMVLKKKGTGKLIKKYSH